ncbi:ABC transporter permease [Alphaproteobacteria bacterium 46_93_T64]|nr:ABC transporter permease [Alphaproteobacteria bacterium 46_93_T64]
MEKGVSARRFPIHIAVFLAPAVLIYSLFMIYPLIDTFRFSLFSPNEAGNLNFVAFDNYVKLLTDPDWSSSFWNALYNNFILFLVHMLVQNPIGLLLAALLSLPVLKGRQIYRTAIFMPTMMSVVIIGFIWQLILNPLWGVAETLMWHVGLDAFFYPWLGDEATALITLSLISVWQWVGIPMMLIYAALLGIPEDLTEAAEIDGASHMQIFWKIKLPLILPTLGVVSVLTFVANFNAFDLIYAVKGALAGPNFSTDIMGTLFYRVFFGFQLQIGDASMGATVATTMFLIILVGILFYLFVIQRRMQRYTF